MPGHRVAVNGLLERFKLRTTRGEELRVERLNGRVGLVLNIPDSRRNDGVPDVGRSTA